MKPVVVIPVYKEYPNSFEQISIRQTFRVLKQHRISLIFPASLSLTQYINIAAEENIVLEANKFDDWYFTDIYSYSRLLLDILFYQRFSSANYMLIVQPDAFVFRDELNYWIEQNYDYIGAPWFKGFHKPKSNKIIGVGNGGFSLRNIQIMISILSSIKFKSRPVYSFKGVFNKSQENYNYTFFEEKFLLKTLYYINNLCYDKIKCLINEDLFISKIFPKVFPDFKVPDPDIAKYFAFEVNPSYLFKACGNKLPFGCHGWFKYETDFWQPFINREGFNYPC